MLPVNIILAAIGKTNEYSGPIIFDICVQQRVIGFYANNCIR